MNDALPHDLLDRLKAAATDQERTWLVTENLLNRLSPALRRAVWAAAVPHWFDAEILAALLDQSSEEAAALYARLQTLPFVEPFEARGGHNVHEVTRALLLDHLWRGRRDEFVTLSSRAADYFARRDEPEWQIEHAYHLLVAAPERGADALWGLGAEWNNAFRHELVYALAQAGVEQAQAGRVEGRGRGWAYFWLGQVEARAYRHPQAAEAFRRALQSVDGDRQLEANCIQALGDVHLRLAEYQAARARYEEARPIYAQIGARLGEANCIQALGDVHLRLAEYEAARARYEEARPIYAQIGARLGEANCIKALGDVHLRLAEYEAARARYEEARPIYAQIGDRLGEANCIQALGDLYVAQQAYEKGLALLEEAVRRFQNLGLPAAVANAINSIASLYDEQGRYQEAVEAYSQALAVHENPMWYRNRALQYIRLGDVGRAAQDIERADRLQPDHPYLYLRKGDLSMLQRDYPDAEAHYRAALERLPRLNAAHFGLGRALLCQGRPQEALSAFRAGLAYTYAASELKDPIRDLETLVSEQPHLPGSSEALAMLRAEYERKRKRQ